MGVSDIELLSAVTSNVIDSVKKDGIVVKKVDKEANPLAQALSGCKTSVEELADDGIVIKKINLPKQEDKKLNPNDKANNGKFDFSQCLKNLGKGLISPITALIKHPIISTGVIAGTIALTTLVPVLGIVIAAGFGAWSTFEIGKGTYDAINNYKNGKYDESEKSFENIGQGIIGVLLSMLGLKQGAKVANEAKLMDKLKVNKLTVEQREEIANAINSSTKLNALKEIASLFTTKAGAKATLKEFSPSMIKQRYSDWKGIHTGESKKTRRITKTDPNEMVKVDRIAEFQKTPEYQRRMAMSDTEIQQKVEAEFNEVFDKIGIPKEQRPKLTFENSNPRRGGGYKHSEHQIEFNFAGYRNGAFEIEDVIMHEATHCQEALLRAGIPKERVENIIKDILVKKIQNGENEKIVVNNTFGGAMMMEPPKLSQSMKNDFIEFAQKYLYKEDKELVYEMTTKKYADNYQPSEQMLTLLGEIKSLIKRHPEFIEQYKTEEEAIEVMTQYTTSHLYRYNAFTYTDIGKGSWGFKEKVDVPEVKGEELAHAEQSLRESCDCLEGNARMSGLNSLLESLGGRKGFNQYQFSSEEVLAQQRGNANFIEKALQEIENLKKAGALTKEREEYLLSAIERAKKTTDYKTTGKEYYKKYTQLLHEPENQGLKTEVERLDKLVDSLEPVEKVPMKYTVEMPYFDVMSHTSLLQKYLLSPMLLKQACNE